MVFDFSLWDRYKWHYIVILVIVILIILYIIQIQTKELSTSSSGRSADGNGDLYYLGRGDKDDSVEMLLNRIEWSSYLFKRTSLWSRILFVTIFIVLLIILVAIRKLPTPSTIVILFFVVFIPVYAAHQFFYTHGDVYNDYYIKNNVKIIRNKLNLSPGEPDDPTSEIPDRPFVMGTSIKYLGPKH